MIKRLNAILFLITICLSASVFSQSSQKKLDSLIASIQTIKNDTHKVNVLNKIAWDISYNSFEKGIDYCYKAIIIAKKINYEKGLSKAYNTLATIYTDLGMSNEAIKYHEMALKISKRLNLKSGIASTYANIGIIYGNQNNNELAKSYFLHSNKIFNDLNDIDAIVKTYLALNQTYRELGMIDSSRYYLEKGFEEAKKIPKNKHLYAYLLLEKAKMAIREENYAYAILQIKAAEEIYKEINSNYDIFDVYNTYGDLYKAQEKYNLAINFYNKCLEYSKYSQLTGVANVFNKLAECYNKTGNYKEAYKLHVNYQALKDSIVSDRSKNQLMVMEMQFKNEKTQLELENLKNLNQLQSAEIQKQNTQKIALGIGLLLMLAMVFFIFRGYNQKKKANELITFQKQEVEKQKTIVEEKNKEILDSIAYAKRLQDAILPPSEVINSTFNNSLIFYQPKDIVAGDFYWMQKAKDEVLFAVADCTGHGVPGAMVSIVCSNALNRSVKEFNITQPAQILNKVSELVEENFSTNESNVQDGMDISLCKLNFQTLSLEYAGAQNPLWIIRNNELIEYKADKQPIGKYADRKPFTNHTIQLEKNDTLFLFSDGYADQFGGDNGKKLKTSNLKKILCSIQEVDMEKQLEFIKMNFERWKGNIEQVDDVCIMGIKV